MENAIKNYYTNIKLCMMGSDEKVGRIVLVSIKIKKKIKIARIFKIISSKPINIFPF